MAQRKSLAWTELRVGLLVIASFVLLALAIFYIGGQTGFFTHHYSVTAYFASANGLRSGADVWLEGVPIGVVKSVGLSTRPEPNRSVAAQLQLDAQYQNIIRSDSQVTIATTGLLGDEHVDITRGSAAGQVIPDGGTLQGEEVGDIKKIITGTNDFIENLDLLSEQVKKMTDRIQNGEGSLGKFMTDPAIFDNANATVKEMDQLVHDVRTGNGTMGRLIGDDKTYQQITTILDRSNDIMEKINSGNGTLGKLLNDSTLFDKFNASAARLQAIADRVDRGEGSLGKFVHDDTIANKTQDVLQHASDLMVTAQNGDGTIGKLMKDPTLYNSVNQTSSEILKLLYDFRQNPTKYLTITFKIF